MARHLVLDTSLVVQAKLKIFIFLQTARFRTKMHYLDFREILDIRLL